MNKEEKIKQIKELFNKLYCFTSQELAEFFERLEFFSLLGLEELEATLREGSQKQDELIGRLIQKDKKFNKKLNDFLQKTTNNLKSDFEATERSDAEKIIENI